MKVLRNVRRKYCLTSFLLHYKVPDFYHIRTYNMCVRGRVGVYELTFIIFMEFRSQ